MSNLQTSSVVTFNPAVVAGQILEPPKPKRKRRTKEETRELHDKIGVYGRFFHWRQADIAEEFGVTQQYVSKVIKANRLDKDTLMMQANWYSIGQSVRPEVVSELSKDIHQSLVRTDLQMREAQAVLDDNDRLDIRTYRLLRDIFRSRYSGNTSGFRRILTDDSMFYPPKPEYLIKLEAERDRPPVPSQGYSLDNIEDCPEEFRERIRYTLEQSEERERRRVADKALGRKPKKPKRKRSSTQTLHDKIQDETKKWQASFPDPEEVKAIRDKARHAMLPYLMMRSIRSETVNLAYRKVLQDRRWDLQLYATELLEDYFRQNLMYVIAFNCESILGIPTAEEWARKCEERTLSKKERLLREVDKIGD